MYKERLRHEHFLAQENLGRTVTLQTNNKLMLHSFNENGKLIQRKNAELAIYPCLAMITSPIQDQTVVPANSCGNGCPNSSAPFACNNPAAFPFSSSVFLRSFLYFRTGAARPVVEANNMKPSTTPIIRPAVFTDVSTF